MYTFFELACLFDQYNMPSTTRICFKVSYNTVSCFVYVFVVNKVHRMNDIHFLLLCCFIVCVHLLLYRITTRSVLFVCELLASY